MKMIKIDLIPLLEEANQEIDLLPYFVKMHLRDHGIPIAIDVNDVRDPDFEVESGTIEYTFIVENFSLEVSYEPADAA